MMTTVYIVLLLLVVAAPMVLGLYAWRRTRVEPPVNAHNIAGTTVPDSPGRQSTSLAEPEVALRIEREQ